VAPTDHSQRIRSAYRNSCLPSDLSGTGPELSCWLSGLCSATAAWLGSRCYGFGACLSIGLKAFWSDQACLRDSQHAAKSGSTSEFAKCSQNSAAVKAADKNLSHEIWVEEIILFRLQKAVPNLSGEIINAQIAMQCMMDVLWINQRT